MPLTTLRHISISGFGGSPCNGRLLQVESSAPVANPRRSLPILGAPSGSPSPLVLTWVCERCGQRWEREPLPEEAL
jgi:hypothetical protein